MESKWRAESDAVSGEQCCWTDVDGRKIRGSQVRLTQPKASVASSDKVKSEEVVNRRGKENM